jgi:hypothetical protein
MSTKKYSDIAKPDTEKQEPCHTVQDLDNRNVPICKVPPGTGLMNTRVCRTPFTYNVPQGARQFENDGASIVFGAVPHAGLTSGYGAKGIPAESIDLVVGRHASANDGKGPKENAVVDNNFGTDAARIFVSRMTDVDQAFGLASDPNVREGRGLIGRSAIGLKADGVRIIGREGVRITTGKMNGGKFGQGGEPNSQGGRAEPVAPKIDLVAGNNYNDIQGVAKGQVTHEALHELRNLIGEIWSALFNFALIQANYNATLGITPQAWIAAAAPAVVQGDYNFVIQSLYQTRTNSNNWNFTYLNPSGKKYIVSRNVRTN